jgi:PAS domain S-box-containing protein
MPPEHELRLFRGGTGALGHDVSAFGAAVAMIDRAEAPMSDSERQALAGAAAAQRALLEAMPVAVSVVAEPDGQVLYANHSWSQPFRLAQDLAGDPRDLLNLLYPEDRAAILEAHRRDGQVDAFEARCRSLDAQPYWVLIATRSLSYQGAAARLTTCTSINGRKRAEAALARRTAMLDAITYAATRIIGAADWRPGMQDLLSRLGTAADVSRAFLFEIHPAPDGKGLAQSVRFDWAAAGLQPLSGHRRYTDLPVPETRGSQLAEWYARRRAGQVVQARLRDTWGDARLLFEESGTFSMLSVPIFVGQSFWGTLGFDDCRSERVWEQSDIDVLRTATALIGGALERARADERLRERESQLVEAQRIAHVGSWELNFHTNEVSWSEEGWRIFGVTGEGAWTHEENLQRIHPADRLRVAEADARARSDGTPVDLEYRVVRPDGEVRTVRERAETICDALGRPVRLIGTVHDVTEMKATEARLRESDERYTLAARGAEIGLWDWDVVSDRAYFSPRLHEILALPAGTLGQSIAALLDRLVPEERLALNAYLQQRFAQRKRKFERDVRFQREGQEHGWLALRGLIVYDASGPVRLVGSARDITDRKLAEEELARQREALHQNEKLAMFGSLLAGVSHELNNPLSVVVGQSAILEQTCEDPAVVERVQRIRAATDRCARIVRTFLGLARQRPAEPRPVSLNAIVQAALDMLSFQLRAGDLRLELDLAPDLQPVMADADQVHQVLTNLVVNALQALAGRARPRILRIATRCDRAGGRALLAVADNGPGVSEELQARIFDPFFTTKPPGEGTGIGLSLSASIARAHGGAIELTQTPGGGATFTLALPLPDQPLDPDDRSESPRPAKGLRVLIVEDEAEIARTLADILHSHGHVSDAAPDGRQALARLAQGTYDLVISDLRMPVLDGPGLYAALQQHHPDIAHRVLFVTGDTLSAESQSFLARAGVPCLEKPFLPEDVIRMAAQVLERRHA